MKKNQYYIDVRWQLIPECRERPVTHWQDSFRKHSHIGIHHTVSPLLRNSCTCRSSLRFRAPCSASRMHELHNADALAMAMAQARGNAYCIRRTGFWANGLCAPPRKNDSVPVCRSPRCAHLTTRKANNLPLFTVRNYMYSGICVWRNRTQW